jgi:predicted nucleotidyltransferase
MGLSLEKLKARRAERARQLKRTLAQAILTLKAMGALKIIAFGSYASGTIRRWSDLDIIVVMPDRKSGKEWFKEIYERIEGETAMDIFPFTPAELKAKAKTTSFIRHALRTGKVVYEKRQKNRGEKLVLSGPGRI